jgi:hypothetical protein
MSLVALLNTSAMLAMHSGVSDVACSDHSDNASDTCSDILDT